MRGRLGMLIGFGAGYVLGAKAGTERYVQLQRLYENLQSSAAFRQATGKVKEAAGTGFESAKDLASEGVSKVKDRKSGTDGQSAGLSVAPPPTH